MNSDFHSGFDFSINNDEVIYLALEFGWDTYLGLWVGDGDKETTDKETT